MGLQVRDRRPPVALLYGDYAPMVLGDENFYKMARDRAAYMYVTGQFPSHLRPKQTDFLRRISREYKKPSGLDGRVGHRMIHDEIAAHLKLEAHNLVRAVRKYIRLGYFIEPSRGHGTRRNFDKIFMFKLGSGNRIVEKITIFGSGAVKRGWD